MENELQKTDADLILGDGAVDKATEMANTLASIVKERGLYSDIKGKAYVHVEGWSTLGAMVGVLPSIVNVEKRETENGYVYQAEVKLTDKNGSEVSRAFGLCSSEEKMAGSKRWHDEYAVLSMAQTRATGKAFRIAFSWVMKLAGYEATPAEEMEAVGARDEKQDISDWSEFKMHFGKHSGKHLGDMPDGYLQWLCTNYDPNSSDHPTSAQDKQLKECLDTAQEEYFGQKTIDVDEERFTDSLPE